MNCRHCNTPLQHVFIDLYNSPASNSFLKQEQLNETEYYFPLKVFVCDSCFLVQLQEYKKASEIFNEEYVYFSSFSSSWLEHAKSYVNMMASTYQYNEDSFIVEIASNDGYLLQYFREKNIPVLGIEPTLNTANEARKKGIDSINDFFGEKLARKEFAEKNRRADLLIGNNVLAHVPDLNDFVKGLKIALKPEGIITLEFPHLLKLVEESQFDTIYHEHFSYLSFYTVNKIFSSFGLKIFNVDQLSTHGGSLRIYATHSDNAKMETAVRVGELMDEEKKAGLNTMEYYQDFQLKAEKVKNDLLEFLLAAKKQNKKVMAYGAAAKGNTLLNYCGIRPDLISHCADASTFKQGLFMPGSHIPVISPEEIKRIKPDYILILPWNLRTEISDQLKYAKEWGCKFIVPIPGLTIM
ncbi:MAG: methyltransferase domain-containing protein [Bacteroidia bacterium]